MEHRQAGRGDLELLYYWANDPTVREASYSSEPIAIEDHQRWFHRKLSDPDSIMLIFEDEEQPVGLVRFDKSEDHWVIGVLVDPGQRGKGYAAQMIKTAVAVSQQKHILPVRAYIKKDNQASIRSFASAGFREEGTLIYKDIESYLYVWK